MTSRRGRPARGEESETAPFESAREERLALYFVDEPDRSPVPIDRLLTMGRDAACEIRIDDESISREHAVFEPGSPAVVRDLGSRNGTFVGGERLADGASHPLQPGTAVRVGGVFLFVDRQRSRPPEVAPPSSRPRRSREGPMAAVFDLADRLATDDITVLLTGETGVGKEVLAQYLHTRSRRSGGPFIPVHAAALTPSLFESELFGYERGAFTGATGERPGLFELADHGTLFFDEIGELPLEMQPKLLRVLEDRKVTRVGGRVSRVVDVRIVAATNRDLAAESARGAFRADLYFRLNAFPLVIPPLRDRRAEIPGLARELLEAASDERQRSAPRIDDDALALLVAHDWPGNVRELRSAMARVLFFAPAGAGSIDAAAIAQVISAGTTAPRGRTPGATSSCSGALAGEADLGEDNTERDRIARALSRHAGNQSAAAAELGIARRTLLYKLDKLGIDRPRKKKK